MALGRFSQSQDTSQLMTDVSSIIQRNQSDLLNSIGKINLNPQENEQLDELKKLNANSAIQIAKLELANRLSERRTLLEGAPKAAQLDSQEVFNFKRFAEVLRAEGDPSITSQDQQAKLISDLGNFLKARNIEATPEFNTQLQQAQQSQILTNTARILTSIPGLDFVNQGDPNFGFGTREKTLEFFNIDNIENAPTRGRNLVNRRNRFFENVSGQQATQEFLDERVFSTPQYQEFTQGMNSEQEAQY